MLNKLGGYTFSTLWDMVVTEILEGFLTRDIFTQEPFIWEPLPWDLFTGQQFISDPFTGEPLTVGSPWLYQHALLNMGIICQELSGKNENEKWDKIEKM